MSTQQLVDELLALPLPERIDVAQTLWESINDACGDELDAAEREAINLAKRRKAELDAGTVAGRSHEQVMLAARRAHTERGDRLRIISVRPASKRERIIYEEG